jgi:hypothetical protein
MPLERLHNGHLYSDTWFQEQKGRREKPTGPIGGGPDGPRSAGETAARQPGTL